MNNFFQWNYIITSANWNFSDIFIICISLYLTSILNEINKKILWAADEVCIQINPFVHWATVENIKTELIGINVGTIVRACVCVKVTSLVPVTPKLHLLKLKRKSPFIFLCLILLHLVSFSNCCIVTNFFPQTHTDLHSIAIVFQYYLSPSIWGHLREDYNRATRLIRRFDDVFGGLVLLSFATNLFWICLQIFNILE